MDNYSTGNNNMQPVQPQSSPFGAGAVSQPQPQRPKKRLLVIALIVLAVVVIGFAAALIFLPKSCFDTDSYKDLVSLAQDFESGEGVDASAITQDQELFTQSIYFQDATATINPELSDDAPSLLQKLGTYYKDHQTTAPISITIESSYQAGTSPEIAKQRIKTIKDSLVRAGVAESSVTAQDPVAVVLDEDSLYDDDVIDGMPVGVRVTPVSRCEM